MLNFQCPVINSFYFKLCLQCLIHIGKSGLYFWHQNDLEMTWPWYDKLLISYNEKETFLWNKSQFLKCHLYFA